MPAAVILGVAAASGLTAAVGGAIGAAIVGSAVSATAATAIGTAVIAGGITAAQGGSASDVLKSAVLGGVTAGVGSGIASSIASDVAFNAIASGTAGQTAVIMGNALGGAAAGAISSGTSALLSGKDPIEALIRGGLTAGLSAGVNASIYEITKDIPMLSQPTGSATGDAIQRATKAAAATAILGGSGTNTFQKSLLDSFANVAGNYIGSAIKDNSEKLKSDADAVKSAEQAIKDNEAKQKAEAEKYNALANQLNAEYNKVESVKGQYESSYATYQAMGGDNATSNTIYNWAINNGYTSGFRGNLKGPDGAYYNTSPSHHNGIFANFISKINAVAEDYNIIVENYNNLYNQQKPILDGYQNTLNTLQSQLPELEKIYVAKANTLNGSVTEFQIQESKNAALALKAIEDIATAKEIYKSDTGSEMTDAELARFVKSGGNLIESVDKSYTSEGEAREMTKAILGREPTESEYMQLIGLSEDEAVKKDIRGALTDAGLISTDGQFTDSGTLTNADIAEITGKETGSYTGVNLAGPGDGIPTGIFVPSWVSLNENERVVEVKIGSEGEKKYVVERVNPNNPEQFITYTVDRDPVTGKIYYGTDGLDANNNIIIKASQKKPVVNWDAETDGSLNEDPLGEVPVEDTKPVDDAPPASGEVVAINPDEGTALVVDGNGNVNVVDNTDGTLVFGDVVSITPPAKTPNKATPPPETQPETTSEKPAPSVPTPDVVDDLEGAGLVENKPSEPTPVEPTFPPAPEPDQVPDSSAGSTGATGSTGITNLEAQTKAQYESLTAKQKALADAMTAQGATLSDAIAAAQQQTQTQIGELTADVQAKFDSLTADQKALATQLQQQGVDFNTAIEVAKTQTQQQITDLGVEVDARINELMQQGQTYQQATQNAFAEVNAKNQEMSELIGTQGRAANQSDIDALNQMLGGQRSMDLAYDVTGDKQITQADIDFLTQVVGGKKTDWMAPQQSPWAATGLYGQIQANELQRQRDLADAEARRIADQEAAAEEARKAGIRSNIRTTATQGRQQLQNIQQQLPQALKAAQEVSTPIYGQMGPYLDIGSELDFGFFKPSPEKQAGTKQQQPTKIAAGGYIDDLLAGDMTADDLLNLLR